MTQTPAADIVERLRTTRASWPLSEEAAIEIEALQRKIDEAVSIPAQHAARWRKRARKHVRPDGRRSDHQEHDLARAKICDAIAADIRGSLASIRGETD